MHTTTNKTPYRQAWEFFYANAGYSVAQGETKAQGKARSARRLAKAEAMAKAQGYTFEWQDDWTVGDHSKEYDCYADGGPETYESCLMRDAVGAVVQSLGCIDDATREYRRVVEAELALEELG